MIEPQQFRALMAGVCAPVTVVTTTTDAGPHGTTVSSFASLSLNPPLVSVAFDRDSALLPQIQAVGRFGVNILGHAQDELAATFARRGDDRFAATDWFTDHGLPRLAARPAGWSASWTAASKPVTTCCCSAWSSAASSRPDLAPLVYAHRTFGTHSRFAERPRPRIADLIAACAS